MFTEKKFRSLERNLRFRKAAQILKDAEQALQMGKAVDIPYLNMILRCALEESDAALENTSQGFLLRSINSYKYKMLKEADIPVADWDMALDTDYSDPDAIRKILPISVYLDDIRSPFNVGSIFRSAESFCFKEILLSPDTPDPTQSRARRSAMGTDTIMEWRKMEKEELAGKPK